MLSVRNLERSLLMPLYETYNYQKFSLVDPDDAEDFNVLQSVKKAVSSHTNRFQTCIDIFDAGIDIGVKVANKNSRWAFTKTAILVGDSAIVGPNDAEFVWETSELAFPLLSSRQIDIDGVDKQRKMFMGGMTRWRIALRPEPWVSYKEDSKRHDPQTGKLIKISTYFVSPQVLKFVMPPKKRNHSIGDLAAKWSNA